MMRKLAVAVGGVALAVLLGFARGIAAALKQRKDKE